MSVPPSLVPGLFSKNWRLKLAAFGLAVVLWGVARGEPRGLVTQSVAAVPVFVEVSDLDWTTAERADPPTVDVRVSGTVGSLARVGRDLTLEVPIDAVGSRDTVVELRRDWVRSANGRSIQVEDINPQQVALTFEPLVPGSVPLALRVSGRLPEDVALLEPILLSSDVVRVRGRESRVAQLDTIDLEVLDLSSISVSGAYPLEVDTTGFGDLNFGVTEVMVDVRLGEAFERVVEGVVVVLDSVSPGQPINEFTFEPSAVSVTLRGERGRVQQVLEAGVRAVVRRASAGSIPAGGSSPMALRIEGVPDLVEGTPSVDLVEVTRAPDEGASR